MAIVSYLTGYQGPIETLLDGAVGTYSVNDSGDAVYCANGNTYTFDAAGNMYASDGAGNGFYSGSDGVYNYPVNVGGGEYYDFGHGYNYPANTGYNSYPAFGF